MKRITIAVCDADPAYGERLAAWISQENKEQFLGCCFSEETLFLEYLDQQQPDIVLVGKGFLERPDILRRFPKTQQEDAGRQEGVLWMWLCDLTEEPELPEAAKGLPRLDKYQPVSQMVREILSYYQAYGRQGEAASFRHELIGIYSPGHSIWQTPFALTLAQILAQREHVLYVSLKECAGFGGWFQERYQKDLVDVMYLCLAGNGNISGSIGSAVYHMADFSYIPPAEDSICLGEIRKEDYLTFLKILEEQSGYSLIIVDFGMMVPGFFELMETCSKVYILTEPGGMQEAPLQHFCQMADRQKRPALRERMDCLTLPSMQPMPCQGGQWLQQWLWGSLGDYVRSLMGVQRGTD